MQTTLSRSDLNGHQTASETQYGYAVNRKVIAKPLDRSPNFWTILDEWTIETESEAIKAQLDGFDVIWSLIDRQEFAQAIKEFKTGEFKNVKGKPTDSKGRRTIDNSLIKYCDTVLIDFDLCPLSSVPKSIIDQSWLMCPSASQTTPSATGDVSKMHFIHKMPNRIPAKYAAAYRKAYLDRVANGLAYDEKCIDPRREFYGKNPEFTDQRFYKVTLENRIPLELHTEILTEVMNLDRKNPYGNVPESVGEFLELNKEPKTKKRGRPKKNADISALVDQHLLSFCDLEEIVNGLFPDSTWNKKGSSPNVFDQYETVNPLRPDAKNATAFAIEHSSESNRILCHYKASDFNCSLYEFYARYKLFQRGDSDAETKNIKSFVSGKGFVDLVGDICNQLGIDEYEFPEEKKKKKPKPPTDVLLKIAENFDRSVMKFCNLNTKVFYFIYNRNSGVWDYNSSLTWYGAELRRLLEDFNSLLLEENPEYQELEEGEVSKMVSFIKEHHANNNWILSQIPSFRNEWIGLSDCDYNTKTNEFAEKSPNHNLYFRFSFSRKDFNATINIKQRYLEAFEFATQNKTTAEILWLYKCAEVLKLGKKAWRALVVSGASRTGKSSFCRSLMYLEASGEKALNVIAEVNQDALNTDFAFSRVNAYTTALHFPELRLYTKQDVNWLLQIVDSSGGININEKFKPIVNIDRDFPVYMSIQDDFKIPAGNVGVESRLLFTEIKLPAKAGLPIADGGIWYKEQENISWCKELNDLYHDPEMQKQLFLWILHNENTQDIERRLDELVGSKEMKDQQKSVLVQNSPLTEMFEEYEIEVTGDENDFVVSKDFRALAKKHLESEEGMSRVSSGYVSGVIQNHIQKKFPNEWESIKKYVTKGEKIDSFIWKDGKSIRVIKGIRFTPKKMNGVRTQETELATF
jgi:hypothetical protein